MAQRVSTSLDFNLRPWATRREAKNESVNCAILIHCPRFPDRLFSGHLIISDNFTDISSFNVLANYSLTGINVKRDTINNV